MPGGRVQKFSEFNYAKNKCTKNEMGEGSPAPGKKYITNSFMHKKISEKVFSFTQFKIKMLDLAPSV